MPPRLQELSLQIEQLREQCRWQMAQTIMSFVITGHRPQNDAQIERDILSRLLQVISPNEFAAYCAWLRATAEASLNSANAEWRRHGMTGTWKFLDSEDPSPAAA